MGTLAWALAFVGRNRLALGHIQLAFVGHKRLPCIQLAFVGRILVVGRMGLALVGHIGRALGRIPLAFVGHRQLPCIQLVVALGRILAEACMGQLGHKLGRAYSLMVVVHQLVGIRHRQVLVVVVVDVLVVLVELVGPFHWRCLLLLQGRLVLVWVVQALVVEVVPSCRRYRCRSNRLDLALVVVLGVVVDHLVLVRHHRPRHHHQQLGLGWWRLRRLGHLLRHHLGHLLLRRLGHLRQHHHLGLGHHHRLLRREDHRLFCGS